MRGLITINFQRDKVSNINIAYIGGGSRGWAWNLIGDLALEEKLSGTVKLYDINYQAAYANEIIGNRMSERDEAKGKWNYKAVETLGEAIVNADFVIISILPGSFKEMASDVHLPEKYGIYQSVGDTVGPGGLVRALRTIPMYVEIAESIKKYCPNAWVINYTNPMTLCVRTLYEVFPEIKAFGCCHEVFGTQKLLARMLMEMKGIENVNKSEIKVNVLGINHFTWIDKVTYKEMDLLPIYKEFVELHYEEGYEDNKGQWMKDSFSSANRVKFDLFKRYGLIAAAGDRHLAEFCPPWYLGTIENAHNWMINITPVSLRVENYNKLIEISKKLVNGEEQTVLRASGEEGIRQIKALLGLEDMITNVNIPNQGQLNEIPNKAVVETNAIFSRDSVRPIQAGKLPVEVHNLVSRHIYNQETVLKAALNKDKEIAFRAFVNDPLVTIGLSDARKLFQEMLENTKEYLPGWNVSVV